MLESKAMLRLDYCEEVPASFIRYAFNAWPSGTERMGQGDLCWVNISSDISSLE
jgi:hypothetical protein